MFGTNLNIIYTSNFNVASLNIYETISVIMKLNKKKIVVRQLLTTQLRVYKSVNTCV